MLVKSISTLTQSEREQFFERGTALQDVHTSVASILEDVKKNGDEAVRRYTKKFDRAIIDEIEVSHKEIHEAVYSLDKNLLLNLKKASMNIRSFHEAQLQKSWMKEFAPGIRLGQRIIPIDSAGAYIPGGKASYPSTALMTVIPAKVAGVEKVIICTPPKLDGSVNPLTLAAAHIAGADHVFKAGGVQAIAAMAFGTDTIPRVNKIVGPGNIYVTAAKLACGAAIDFPAGPSEILIIADSTAKADLIASDMIAQAEHDPDAVSILVTSSNELAENVRHEIEAQIETAARKEIITKSLKNAAILIGSLDECIEFSNQFAPEHLEIMTGEDIFDRIRRAGSIFIGSYAPVSAGDYASGTNHVLPTAGYARTVSGLNIDHFMTKSSVQIIDRKGLMNLREIIMGLADAEGLPAHANAVKIRLQQNP